MKTLTINSGWFRAAGNVYRWPKDLHMFGVGIDGRILHSEKQIQVVVEGVRYTLDCVQAVSFCKAHRSVKRMRGGTTLGVVSKSLLKPVLNFKIKIEKKTHECL